MHPGQLEISLPTVRTLVDDQFPHWRGLPLRPVESFGTVNAIFRIGEKLAARFPLRPEEPVTVREWLTAEAEAARELAGRTRVPTPVPVALGEPGAGYPLPWAVQTWLPGALAGHDESTAFARDLAEFIRDVRAIDTRGRPFRGYGRGGDLRTHDDWMRTCFRRSEGLLDVAKAEARWAELRELPRTADDVMAHGDLIVGNVLVHHGRLIGVLDVGGLGPADPALDLIGAWHFFDDEVRQVFRAELACDDLEWERGRAWAFQQAMGMVWYYIDSNPTMCQLGRRTLDRIDRSWRRPSG